jgi:hypothetical protein
MLFTNKATTPKTGNEASKVNDQVNDQMNDQVENKVACKDTKVSP